MVEDSSTPQLAETATRRSDDMHAHVVHVDIQDVAAATKGVTETVIPDLKQAPGFMGARTSWPSTTRKASPSRSSTPRSRRKRRRHPADGTGAGVTMTKVEIGRVGSALRSKRPKATKGPPRAAGYRGPGEHDSIPLRRLRQPHALRRHHLADDEVVPPLHGRAASSRSRTRRCCAATSTRSSVAGAATGAAWSSFDDEELVEPGTPSKAS